MEQRQAQPHPGERVRAPTTKPGWEGKRPLFWRLPLLAFLVSGVVCLNYLDGRLSSDYRKSAADLAIQADAMIEGAVQNRAASINGVRRLLAAAATPREERARLDAIGNAIVASSPEVVRIFRLDETGAVRQAIPSVATADDITSENHLLVA